MTPLHAVLLASLLASPPAHREATVELRLADGRPAADANVVPLRTGADGTVAGEPVHLDAEGKGLLPFVPRYLFVEGGPGACPSVVVVRDGRASLPACAERRFKVVDAAGGRPVKDATAICLSAEGWQRLDGNEVGGSLPLGPTGQGGVRSEKGAVFCRFLAPAYGVGAFVRIAGGASSAAAPIVVTMNEGAPVGALLVDARGEPVAGRTVRAAVKPRADDRARQGQRPWLPLARVPSNERGRIRFAGLPWPVRLFIDDPASPPAFQLCESPSPVPCTLVVPDEAQLEAVFLLDGQPVAGARMSVVQIDSRDPEKVARREAESDAEGRAVVRGLSRALDRARVEVEAPGGISDQRLLASPLDAKLSLGEWALEACVPVTLSVLSPDGKPIPGSRVFDPRSRRTFGTTDDRGTLSIPVPTKAGRSVSVDAAGFLPGTLTLSAGVPSRISLSRKGRVTLRARTSDGRLVREAVLGAEGHGAIQREVKSHPAGDDELAFDVPPGDTHWLLRAEGAEQLDLGTFSVAPGEIHAVGTVEVSVGATVDGRLLSRDSGQPLAGASVTAQPVRDQDVLDVLNERLPSATTGLDGSFRVTGLPPGRTRLFLEAPGYSVMRLDVDALLDGTQAGSVFMERGKPLEVRLRNASGEPVGDVRLRVRPGGLDGTLREASYRSGEGGIVTIPRIAAGTWGLVAEAPGTSPRRRVVLDGSETSLEWSLAGTAVTGQLTLGGRPVTEASVTVRTSQAGIRMIQLDRNTPEGLSLEPLRIGDAPQVSAVAVDADGRYRIDSVTEDDVILFAAGPGWASQPIRLSLPGRGEVRQDIALGEQRLLVKVVDGDRNVVPSASVALVGDGATGLSQASTDGDGRATLFLSGSVPIRAIRASDAARRRGFAPIRDTAERDVTVLLGPAPGPAEVSVQDADGRPAPQANVCAISDADGSVRRARTDLHGVVRLDDLDEGSYRLLAEGTKSAFGTAALRVVASGGTATVRLSATGALHLRLQTESAEYDAARIRIEILDADGHDLAADAAALGRPARFRDDDRYVLPVLPPGSYRVRVTDHDRTLLDEPARIRVGERREMMVKLK